MSLIYSLIHPSTSFITSSPRDYPQIYETQPWTENWEPPKVANPDSDGLWEMCQGVWKPMLERICLVWDIIYKEMIILSICALDIREKRQ